MAVSELDSDISKREMRVLVAEDNLINQKVLRIILEKAGLEYVIANDGIEALQMYESGKFDLILMDCQMPNLDGLEATKQIRLIETSGQKIPCPIIAMTANAMKGDRERCISAGMTDFLAKPFKSQELLKIIEVWGANNVAN